MITHHEIRLARLDDAPQIAEMSRDLIEHGMAWRWTTASIQACIRSRTTNVAVAPAEHGLAGFAIMQYKDDEAPLSLLAVHPAHRRKRIGAALMAWHEAAALTAGIGTIYLESRAHNAEGRAFYLGLGYREVQFVRGYYANREDGVRFAKDLWAQVPAGSSDPARG